MDKRYYIISTILLLICIVASAKAERPILVLDPSYAWTLPDPLETKTVPRIPHPVRNIYDLDFESADTCHSSVQLADIIQSAMDFSDQVDWEWKPIGISTCGDDVLLFYNIFNPYQFTVYACLNPNQEGFPSTLLIINGGATDPWPSVWFEIEGNTITLYNGDWDEKSHIRIQSIEKYVVDNGAFKLVSVRYSNEKFSLDKDIDWIKLLF